MFFGEYTLDQGCEVELSASEVCLYMEDVIGMSDLSEQGLGSVSGYALNCAVSDWTRRGHSGAESFANANDWNGDKLRSGLLLVRSSAKCTYAHGKGRLELGESCERVAMECNRATE